MLRKPYLVERDFRPGEPEEGFFETVRGNARLRDDSLVRDLFYGTFRSVASCPVCQHMSLKFEPFSILSVSVKDTLRATVLLYHLPELAF